MRVLNLGSGKREAGAAALSVDIAPGVPAWYMHFELEVVK